jgi:hypothetical protein
MGYVSIKHIVMKLTFTELRIIAQLKQAVEQGRIQEGMEIFFSMKRILDKLKVIKTIQL